MLEHFKGELDSAIDSYVPMKGKRSKKKHLSKEAFIKLFFLLFPLCRGEAGLLVTAKYGYFRD